MDLGSGEWKNLDPSGRPPGKPVGMVYLPAEDCVFAGCFTGFEKESPEGQEAVYDFQRNAWTAFPAKVRKRVIPRGTPWRPESMHAYHCAWAQVAYSPKHNLLMRFQGAGGMWVMRPELGRPERAR